MIDIKAFIERELPAIKYTVSYQVSKSTELDILFCRLVEAIDALWAENQQLERFLNPPLEGDIDKEIGETMNE